MVWFGLDWFEGFEAAGACEGQGGWASDQNLGEAEGRPKLRLPVGFPFRTKLKNPFGVEMDAVFTYALVILPILGRLRQHPRFFGGFGFRCSH